MNVAPIRKLRADESAIELLLRELLAEQRKTNVLLIQLRRYAAVAPLATRFLTRCTAYCATRYSIRLTCTPWRTRA